MLVALLLPAAAAAQPQAGIREMRAAYGPLAACIGDYAVQVRAGEAVSVDLDGAGNALLLELHTNGAEGFRATLGPPADLEATIPSRSSAFVLPGGVKGIRIDYRKWSGYRAGIPGEMVFVRLPAHRNYLLSSGLNGSPPVTVSAPVFRERYDDSPLLGRLVRRAAVECATLDPSDAMGKQPAAAMWRPESLSGPVSVCLDGLRVAVPAGSSLKRSWRRGPQDPAGFTLSGDGQDFMIFYGWSYPKKKPPLGSFDKLGFRLDEYQSDYASFTAPFTVNGSNAQYEYFTVHHHQATREQLQSLLKILSYAGKTPHCEIDGN